MDVFDLTATIRLEVDDYLAGLNRAEKQTVGFSGKTTGIFGKMATVGVAAVTAATGAVVGFGASAVDAGRDFDQSMSQVAATMGKTVDQMSEEVGHASTSFGEFEGNLRDFAQFMGQNTAFSATQAADALNYMALAGYNTQQSMDMLPNVLSLAAAGAMDLATASDMVTDTQTAFGIDAARTTQLVDEMAKAASTGNTSVSQLGNAFLTIGGLAKDLNGGMVTLADGTTQTVDGVQELEIALTAMANAGIKGSEAGTHMRNMLLKLSSPTGEGAAMFEELGVKIFDADGKMRSLKDVFTDLNAGLSNLTQEKKLQAIADIFNTRDVASAQALLTAVGESWDHIGESILDAQGAAAEMADTQLDNLAGDITLFQSALEGAQIVVSDKLTPSLRDFVQFGTKGLSELTDAFQEGGLEGAVKKFGDLLSDGITIILGKIPDFVSAGVQLLSALAKGLIKNKNKIINAAKEIMRAFTTALGKEFPAIKSILMNVQNVFDAVFGYIEKNGTTIKAAIEGILTGFLSFKAAIAIFDGIQKGITLVTTAMKLMNGEMALSAVVNPYVAIAAAIGVVIGLIVTLNEKERMEHEERLAGLSAVSEATQEAVQHAQEYMDKVGGIYENNMKVKQSVDEQYASEQALMEELRGIVDENGKVKEGYEERAQIISEELANAFNVEIEYQEGVIQKYDEVMSKLDELILKKKAEALIDANKDEYYAAVKNQVQLFEDLDTTQKEYNETLALHTDAISRATTAMKTYEEESERAMDYAATEKAWEEWQAAAEEADAYRAKLHELSGSLNEVQTAYYTSQDFINDYNELMDVTTTGIGDLDRAVNDMTNNIVENAPIEILEQQVEDSVGYLNKLLEAQDQGVAVSEQQIADAMERVQAAVDAFKSAGQDGADGYAEGLGEDSEAVKAAKKVVDDALKALETAQDSHSPSKEFKKRGVDAIEGYKLGMEEQTSNLIVSVSNIIDSVKDEFSLLPEQALEWGRDLILNFAKGIKEKTSEGINAITEFAQGIKDKVGFSEPKEGPLSDFHTYAPDMMKLFAEGVDQNADLVYGSVNRAFDFKDAINPPIVDAVYAGPAYANASQQGMDSIYLQKMVILMEQILAKDTDVVIEGDAADIFHVVERENKINTRATGYNQLSMRGVY